MNTLSKAELRELAATISQFLKDRNAEDEVVLLLVHELQESELGYTGTMSFMSTIDPTAAAHIMEFQAANIRAGRRGDVIMVHTTKGEPNVKN